MADQFPLARTLDRLGAEHGEDVLADALGVLLPGFVGEELPGWADTALRRGLGGLFLFGHNVDSPAQLRELSRDLRECSETAVLASDEEGGTVTRVQQREGSDWPGHRVLGRLDDPELTRSIAAEMGAWMRHCGVDLAAAPVLDVDGTTDNPVIGVRSFGGKPGLVARHGVAFAAGLADAGVIACAKHFPGHGATHTDSHLGVPTVEDDLETVRRRDLAPFAAAVRAGVPAIMSAHVVHRALSPEPATLSAGTVELLRRDLGFEGVLCSDALDMHAISRGVGRRRGAVLALRAGVDLLCLGNPRYPEHYDPEADTADVVTAVCAAVTDGALPRERLAQAARRVRALRGNRPGPHSQGPVAPGPEATGPVATEPTVTEPGCPGTTALGHRAARLAVSVTGDLPAPGRMRLCTAPGAGNIAAGTRQEAFSQALAESAADVTPAGGGGQPECVVLITDDSSDLADVGWEGIAVVVHTGCREPAVPPGICLIRTYGGGRASGLAAGAVLAEHAGGAGR